MTNFTEEINNKDVILSSNRYITKEVIISAKKVREIGMKNFSLSGEQISIKRNSFISFESSLERDFIQLIEFDRDVYLYYEQPLKIYFIKNEKKTVYVPDFYVKYNDGRPDELIEIKYRIDLRNNWSKYKEKFKAAKKFCDENMIKFRIIDESHIRTSKLFNSKFLLNYSRTKSIINNQILHTIQDYLIKIDYSSPAEILKNLCADNDSKAKFIYVIWYMLSVDLIKSDLNQKLNMNSKIWI